MLNKLRDVDSLSTMTIFCNLHTSFPYGDDEVEEQVYIEQQIFKKCYEEKYYLAIAENYTTSKILDLYHKSKDNKFIMLYIFFCNNVHMHKKVIELYDSFDYFPYVNEITIHNTIISLQFLKQYERVYSIIDSLNLNAPRFVLEKIVAAQELGMYEDSYALSKGLVKKQLTHQLKVKAHFALAQAEYLLKKPKKLIERLKFLENEYLLLNDYLNMHSFLLHKYFDYVGDTYKAFEYLKKAAFFHTEKDNDFRYKLQAINKIIKNHKVYYSQFFEQDSVIEEYNLLQKQYLIERIQLFFEVMEVNRIQCK